MNFTPVMGWYYRSSYDRTPSWTGVEYLYHFLVAAHTYDALDRPLSSYIYDTARFIHIDGVRTW